jgi:simple sugar transport system permease protein
MDTFALDFLVASLRIASPLLFGALGGILSERSGVFGVGIEGMLLAGAFGAAIGTFLSAQPAIGILASVICGALVACVIGVVAVRYGADQMVAGLALNILVLGLTSYLLRSLVGGGHAPVIQVPLLPTWPIPFLADLPVVGILFRQQPLTYLGLIAIVPMTLMLFRTQLGLTLRAVGENPTAAFAAGAHPNRVRFAAVVAGGAIAGLGGAVLVLQQIGTFTDGMTGGRGYLVLAALIVGRWMPLASFLACLVFGAAEVLQLHLQSWSLPFSSYTAQMLPYLIALAVLVMLGRSSRLPAAIGVPYR